MCIARAQLSEAKRIIVISLWIRSDGSSYTRPSLRIILQEPAKRPVIFTVPFLTPKGPYPSTVSRDESLEARWRAENAGIMQLRLTWGAVVIGVAGGSRVQSR